MSVTPTPSPYSTSNGGRALKVISEVVSYPGSCPYPVCQARVDAPAAHPSRKIWSCRLARLDAPSSWRVAHHAGRGGGVVAPSQVRLQL